MFPLAQSPLLLFDATSAFLTFQRRLRPMSLVDPNPWLKAPRCSYRAPQHSSNESALFFTWRLPSVGKILPYLSEVPPSGFGYPLGGVSSTHSRKPFSAPYAPGLRPTKFFSEHLVECRFPNIFSVHALFSKTSSALNRRSNVSSQVLSRTPLRFQKD